MSRAYRLRGKIRSPDDARRDYYAGKITADEYFQTIKNSPKGDRTRRRIEREFRKLVAPIIGNGSVV